MRSFFSIRWILSHLFVLAMVVLMVNLGFWQLRRLDERKAMNAQIRLAQAADPVDIADLLDVNDSPADFTPVSASGVYDVDNEVLIANRTFESQAGSWLVTPLTLDDGRVVAVVRGWVPRLWVAGSDTRDGAAPTGRVIVGGVTFSSLGGGRVADAKVSGLPEFNRMDITKFVEATGIPFETTWIRLETQDPPPGVLPIAVPKRVLDNGTHLSYAIQWFFFSSATIVVYYLILRNKKRELALEP